MIVYVKEKGTCRWYEAAEVILNDEDLVIRQTILASGLIYHLKDVEEYTIYGPGGVCLDAEEGDLDIPER